MFKGFGCEYLVWNTSLYQGFSYTTKIKNEDSFMSLCRDKVIILLNNEFKDNDNKDVYSS